MHHPLTLLSFPTHSLCAACRAQAAQLRIQAQGECGGIQLASTASRKHTNSCVDHACMCVLHTHSHLRPRSCMPIMRVWCPRLASLTHHTHNAHHHTQANVRNYFSIFDEIKKQREGGIPLAQPRPAMPMGMRPPLGMMGGGMMGGGPPGVCVCVSLLIAHWSCNAISSQYFNGCVCAFLLSVCRHDAAAIWWASR